MPPELETGMKQRYFGLRITVVKKPYVSPESASRDRCVGAASVRPVGEMPGHEMVRDATGGINVCEMTRHDIPPFNV